MHIEPMKDGDIVEVSELLRACFHWLADREGFDERQRAFLTGERSSAETVRTESATRPHLVAREDGPAGAIAGVLAVNGNQIARLYVHPRFHRRGVGKELFDAGIAMMRQAGHQEAVVGALVESAAAFYKAMGMHVTGQVEWEPELFPDHPVTLLAKPIA